MSITIMLTVMLEHFKCLMKVQSVVWLYCLVAENFCAGYDLKELAHTSVDKLLGKYGEGASPMVIHLLLMLVINPFN